MKCLSIEQCVEFVLSGPGTLDAEAAHVRECADCTARLEQMQDVLGRVEGAMSQFDRNHATGRRRLVEALANVAIEQPLHATIVPNHQADQDLLTRLTAGQDTLVRPAVRTISSPSKRRHLMRVLVPSAAAALVLLGGLGWLLFNNTTSVALADVVKAAEKHKLVKYKETQTTEDRKENLTASSDRVVYVDLKAPRMRREHKSLTLNGVVEHVTVDIQDDRKGRNLMITTETLVPGADKDPEKTRLLPEGRIFPFKHALLWRSENDSDPKKKPKTLLENLRELEKHKDAVVTKDKLGGREAVRYYIEDGKKTTKLWVDAKTNLPMRFEFEILDATPDIPLNKWVHTDFEWDPELKGFKNLDELFDTNPPAGYELEDKTKDTDKK